MAVWEQAVQGCMGIGGSFWQKSWVKTAVRQGGYFVLGLAMGAGRLFSGCGPFGWAAVAAAGTELTGVFCLVGVMAGYLLVGGIAAGIRYIATAMMLFTVAFAVRRTKMPKTRWFMPLVGAVLAGCAGALYGIYTLGGVPGPMRLFMEVVLTGGCTFFFGLVLRPESLATEAAELRHSISFVIFAACALMGLSRLMLWNSLSIGRFLAMLVVMAAGFCGGPMTGCTAGAAMGLGMDIGQGMSLFYTAAYALAGLTSGALYRYGRLTFAVVFCAANGVAVLLGWSEGTHLSGLYECFAASVVFMILPQGVLAPVGTLLHVGRGRGETAYRLYQAQRLTQLSQGFGRLHDRAAQGALPTDTETPVTAVFDRAADIVCRSCGGKKQCWKKDYSDTVKSLEGLTDTMLRKGTLAVGDLPMGFRQKCVAPGAFVSAVNGELRGYLYRRQYQARLQECRAAAYGQFLDMASVLGRAAQELGGTAGPDALAERRLIRFLKSHDREGVCAAFRDGRGRLHAALEGVDMETLAEEPDYLERLSEAVGVRLCRVDKEEKGHLILRQAEPLAVSVGIASMKKEGESVSGDRGTYFKTDSGLLCVILSDGMGTGQTAAKESVSAVEILEQMLKAGMEPECAMRLLNASALLNNGEDWGYATVDLCCIDLFSGDTRFYKYGAAPSYVKTGRAIRRVKGTSLAAGMLAGEESAPDVVKMRLKPGHVALIASDGVMAERQDGWIRSILAECDGWDTSQIARQTLQAAVSRFGNADDMTALALRVEERL